MLLNLFSQKKVFFFFLFLLFLVVSGRRDFICVYVGLVFLLFFAFWFWFLFLMIAPTYFLL